MEMKPDTTVGKSLWGYGIAAVYSIFALATLGIVAFTMTQKVELVAKDYYAQEVKYEQQINRVRQTNNLNQGLTCQLSTEGKFIALQFPRKLAAIQGKIVLYRPSESALDLEFAVAPDKDDLQLISTAKLVKGFWRVKVSWAAEGSEFYNEFLLQIP